MHHPKRLYSSKDLDITFFQNLGKNIKIIQHKSGAIPSNEDGSHDPWDHIESIMGLNFVKENESSKRAFNWLVKNQNEDGSWFAKYKHNIPVEKTNQHILDHIFLLLLYIIIRFLMIKIF